jgi:hypothetical protein
MHRAHSSVVDQRSRCMRSRHHMLLLLSSSSILLPVSTSPMTIERKDCETNEPKSSCEALLNNTKLTRIEVAYAWINRVPTRVMMELIFGLALTASTCTRIIPLVCRHWHQMVITSSSLSLERHWRQQAIARMDDIFMDASLISGHMNMATNFIRSNTMLHDFHQDEDPKASPTPSLISSYSCPLPMASIGWRHRTVVRECLMARWRSGRYRLMNTRAISKDARGALTCMTPHNHIICAPSNGSLQIISSIPSPREFLIDAHTMMKAKDVPDPMKRIRLGERPCITPFLPYSSHHALITTSRQLIVANVTTGQYVECGLPTNKFRVSVLADGHTSQPMAYISTYNHGITEWDLTTMTAKRQTLPLGMRGYRMCINDDSSCIAHGSETDQPLPPFVIDRRSLDVVHQTERFYATSPHWRGHYLTFSGRNMTHMYDTRRGLSNKGIIWSMEHDDWVSAVFDLDTKLIVLRWLYHPHARVYDLNKPSSKATSFAEELYSIPCSNEASSRMMLTYDRLLIGGEGKRSIVCDFV